MKPVAILCCLLAPYFTTAQIIDPRLHIDQFGYLPGAQKIAVLASPQMGYNANPLYPDWQFRVKRLSDHATVFTGPIQDWDSGHIHSQSGDKVWWFDFSALHTVGEYYLYDSVNNARSYPFKISDCAYDQALKDAFRTFYYQRCGTPKQLPFAETPWTDAMACHVGNLQDLACYNVQNPTPASAKDLHGGWHDAGDYNKYVTFTYGPLLDLLLAYEQHPGIWTDDNDIPESGNGVPDLLDEVKYELDWLLRMQQSDGGVLSVVGVKNFASASPPSADHAQRFYGPATEAASLSAAAAFALASVQFQSIPGMSAYADQLRAAAVAAWNWADSHPGAEFYNSGIVAAGENQTDAYETQMRKLGAACFLFAATGSDIYRQAGINLYQQAHLILWSYAYLFEPHTQEVLMYFSNLPGVPANVKNNIQNTYSNSIQNGNADNLPAFLNQADAYRAFVRDDNYTWGSNEFKAHQGNMFFLMNELGLNAVNQTNYRNAGSGFLHYLHGVNPTGYCYLSNMNGRGASFSIPSLYHGWFNDGTIWDEVGVSTHGPAPGFMPGGPNPYFHPDGSCNCVISPPENQPIQKSFKSWNTGWPQNSWELSEVAIYTQAAYLRLLSNVLAGKSNPPQCGGVSSTLDVLSLHALAIFPNPADQTLVIKSPDEPVVCRIFRSTGELVERLHLKAGESVSFQTADLPVGPYFLNWQSTKGEKRGNFTFQVVH